MLPIRTPVGPIRPVVPCPLFIKGEGGTYCIAVFGA